MYDFCFLKTFSDSDHTAGVIRNFKDICFDKIFGKFCMMSRQEGRMKTSDSVDHKICIFCLRKNSLGVFVLA